MKAKNGKKISVVCFYKFLQFSRKRSILNFSKNSPAMQRKII